MRCIGFDLTDLLRTDGTTNWATTSDAPTAIMFTPVRGTRIRLTLTSRHPGEARGAVRISRLDVLAL